MTKGKDKKGKTVRPRGTTGTANRRGRLEEVWVVRDPSPLSVLEDILFKATPNELARVVLGSGLDTWVFENHTFYDNADDARADALHRLQARGARP